MEIGVKSLSTGRHIFRSSVPASAYGDAAAQCGLAFRSEIEVEATVDKMAEELYVQATVKAAVRTECSRCLDALDLRLQAMFEAFYAPAPAEDETESRSKREERESQRVLHYAGGVVDLGEQIIEALALAVPMKPLCRENCKGLCPRCGGNLNNGPCECRDNDGFGKAFRGLFR